jgi:uncharacterized membrane-anchored protein YitT (DUF2179 family)
VNVVAVYVQRRWGINAGSLQLLLDAVILLAGSAALGNLDKLPSSVLAVAVLNGVLMLNHRPGRPVSAG